MTWNKLSKPMPDYVRRKLSEKLKGKLKFPDRFFTCERCGKKVRIVDMAKWKRSKKHYCSRNCSNKMLIGRKLSEEHRKKVIRTLRHDGMVGKTPWNKGVSNLKGRGKNCHLWRGGVTKIGAQIRTCVEYKEWRRKCLERDNFTCQFCGQRGGWKHVDHITSLSDLIRKNNITSLEMARSCKELWLMKNGRTLCRSCHEGTDTYLKNLLNKSKS